MTLRWFVLAMSLVSLASALFVFWVNLRTSRMLRDALRRERLLWSALQTIATTSRLTAAGVEALQNVWAEYQRQGREI